VTVITDFVLQMRTDMENNEEQNWRTDEETGRWRIHNEKSRLRTDR